MNNATKLTADTAAGRVASIDGIEIETGLRNCADDPDFYAEIAGDYAETDNGIPLNDYFEANEWKKYQVLVHKMKSASYMIGAMKLGDMAKGLEDAANDESDIDYIKERHSEFIDAYDLMIKSIRNALGTNI